MEKVEKDLTTDQEVAEREAVQSEPEEVYDVAIVDVDMQESLTELESIPIAKEFTDGLNLEVPEQLAEETRANSQTKRMSTLTNKIKDSLVTNSLQEENIARGTDISIARIEEITKRKKEARELRQQRRQDREDRKVNVAIEREREDQERREMESQERETERTNRSEEMRILYNDYDELLLQAIEDEISTSETTIKSMDTIQSNRYSFAMDLFASLEDLPRLSELTVSSDAGDPASVIRNVSTYNLQSDLDVGRFVDPLTGGSLETTESTDEIPDECEEHIPETDNSTVSYNIDEKAPSFESFKDSEIDTEPAVLNFNFSQALLKDNSLHSSELEERMNISHQTVIDFIELLIHIVVSKAEKAACHASLTQRLDKTKVYKELSKVVEDYLNEKYRNNNLITKIVEHLRRCHIKRGMTALNSNEEKKEKCRYKDALERLDRILFRAAETKSKCARLMPSVLLELQNAYYISVSLETRFTALVHKTLRTIDSQTLTQMVDRELNFLFRVRNEISDIRFNVIQKNHHLARYDEQLNEITTINDDVNMDTFIHVQNECITLEKKVEEKMTTLTSMHSQYYEELQTLAHIREKCSGISEKLQIVHSEYKSKQAHQMQLHNQIFKLKIERDKMRRELRSIHYQGGLLFHHSLMIDFDNTIEKIQQLKSLVQKKKSNLQQLETKLESIRIPKDRL